MRVLSVAHLISSRWYTDTWTFFCLVEKWQNNYNNAYEGIRGRCTETVLVTCQPNNRTLHRSRSPCAAALCNHITVGMHHQPSGRGERAGQSRWLPLMMCLWCACLLAAGQLPSAPEGLQPSQLGKWKENNKEEKNKIWGLQPIDCIVDGLG